MKKILFAALLLLSCSLSAQTYKLWTKGKMPNSKGLEIKDTIRNNRLFRVAEPSIEVFTPSKEENQHFAVLVIPGGGYSHESFVVSGTQIAKYFNTLGGTAYVLYYRLPQSPDVINSALAPLQDGQRAIQLMRSLAKKYDYDADKIGVFGTSAGGHLASSLGVFTENFMQVNDSLSTYSYNPNFMILLSPVTNLNDPYTHKGSRIELLGKNASQELIDKYSTNLHVTEKTPPTLLLQANDDPAVPSFSSAMMYIALRQKHVNASLHIFPHGKHSINMTTVPISTRLWMPIVDTWLQELFGEKETK